MTSPNKSPARRDQPTQQRPLADCWRPKRVRAQPLAARTMILGGDSGASLKGMARTERFQRCPDMDLHQTRSRSTVSTLMYQGLLGGAVVTGEADEASADRRRPMPWENCGAALLLIGVFPLAPILLELLLSGNIAIDSLTLTAAIYAVTIAVASYRVILFISGFLVALFECVLYGQDVTVTPVKHPGVASFLGVKISGNGSSPSHAGLILLVIILLFTSLAIERFVRHVKDHEDFFEFLKKSGS